MTAIALYMGDLKNAQNTAEFQIIKFKKGFDKIRSSESRKQVKFYLDLTKKLWTARQMIAEEGKNPKKKKRKIFKNINHR